MKRLAALLSALIICMGCALSHGETTTKMDGFAPIFAVRYETIERKEDRDRYFICREKLVTANESVNARLDAIGEELEAKARPLMQPDERKNARRNSRLDVEMIHSITGDSWMSVMTLARVSYDRAQLASPFETHTWDLETGEEIFLTDLFPSDSAAWELLSSRTREKLQTVFPNDERDAAAIDRLCGRESLEQMPFTLHCMELTLHIEAASIFPSRTNLIHVRFYYDELWDDMSEEARRQTDNSDWKMVALTCDDGPSYAESAKVITNLRHEGARATFFTVGKKVAENPDIALRAFDENHSIASHTYEHWSGYSMGAEQRHEQLDKHNVLLEDLTGEAVTLFRAPGGTYPPWVECEIGIPIIQWSVDTYDYTGKNAKKIFYSIRNNLKDGDIILSHDSGLQFFKAVPIFAQWMRENGYHMVTVEELCHANGVTLEPNVVYCRAFEGDSSERPDSNIN